MKTIIISIYKEIKGIFKDLRDISKGYIKRLKDYYYGNKDAALLHSQLLVVNLVAIIAFKFTLTAVIYCIFVSGVLISVQRIFK